MITFRDKEYSSKADIVRFLFDSGELTMKSDSKKKVAEELQMTVQTVHATLVKHNKISVVKITKPASIDNITISPVPTQLKNKVLKAKQSNSINAEDHRFEIITAPNPWGLPVCNPPLVMVDNTFTQSSLNKWHDALEI